MVKNIAPPIGTLFEHNGSKYRVGGYARISTGKPVTPTPEMKFLLEILGGEFPRNCMRWCIREQATHVTGSGVSGTIAPVSEIKITGFVNWDGKTLREYEESAKRRGEAQEPIY